MTPRAYQRRVATITALRNQQKLNWYLWGGTPYGSAGYGSYGNFGYGAGWGYPPLFGYPMFLGGWGCDPLDILSPCYGLAAYDNCGANWLNPAWPLYSPSFSGYPFGWYGGFNSYNVGFFSPFLMNSWDMPFGASSCFSSGLSPYRTSTFGTFSPAAATTKALETTSVGPWGLTTSSTSATLFEAKNPAPGEPVTLVLTNGTTVRATQYWVGNGQLHYVTAAGVSAAVPVAQLDMDATMKLNERNGVHFLAPSPAAPTHP